MAVIGIGGSFLINYLPAFKEKVIETINPAAKEARLLNELGGTLNELELNLKQKTSAKNNAELITKARNLLSEAADTNNKDQGLVYSTLGKIISSLIDHAPFPADHLQLPNITSLTSTNNCPSPSPK